MDNLTTAQRSERMGKIRSKHTNLELTVRRLVHRMGYRYRLHHKDLPGKPDLVFTAKRKIIFVNGCFWHRHTSRKCKLARLPKSRLNFWLPKLKANQIRDKRNYSQLSKDSWQVLIVWECELSDKDRLRRKIKSFLGTP